MDTIDAFDINCITNRINVCFFEKNKIEYKFKISVKMKIKHIFTDGKKCTYITYV